MSITIDAITYDVDIKVVNRKVDKLYKYAERTQDGKLQAELIGVFYNFDVECGMSQNNTADYAALFLLLSDATEFHTITNMPGAPSGYTTIECYFNSINDELKRYQKNGVDYFRNLSFSIISRNPARTP